MILMGQTFGFVDNLQDWELFVRACIHLVQTLSHRRDLLVKHKSIIAQE